MAQWKYTIELGDLISDAGDEIPFPERRDAIIARIKAANLPDEDGDLEDILFDMGCADDEEEFDNDGWYRFYNWADDNRVWVDGFSPEAGPMTEEVR